MTITTGEQPMTKVSAIEQKKTIQVIVADDHPLIRSGIRTILAAHPEYSLLRDAKCGEQVIDFCRQLQPDILILDLNMPGPSPVSIVSTLRTECPDLKVVILTADGPNHLVRQLISLGVQGYVLKDEDLDTLLHAMQTVYQGGFWFSHEINEKLRGWLTGLPDATVDLLSCRELEVLQQMAQGSTNEVIAQALGISDRTTRYHVEQIRQKLQVENRTEAVVKALKLGLIRV